VSLTRDFSVFIDLSGGRDLVNVLANGYYMHSARFVKGYQTINPSEIELFFMRIGHLLTSTFACSFWNILADGIICALTSLSRIIRPFTLKNRVSIFMGIGHSLTSTFALFFVRTARYYHRLC